MSFNVVYITSRRSGAVFLFSSLSPAGALDGSARQVGCRETLRGSGSAVGFARYEIVKVRRPAYRRRKTQKSRYMNFRRWAQYALSGFVHISTCNKSFLFSAGRFPLCQGHYKCFFPVCQGKCRKNAGFFPRVFSAILRVLRGSVPLLPRFSRKNGLPRPLSLRSRAVSRLIPPPGRGIMQVCPGGPGTVNKSTERREE